MTDLVASAAALAPGAPAVTDGLRTLSYAELDQYVEATAQRLVAVGIQPHDVVAIQLCPTLAAVGLVHAVRRAGAVLAPFHPRWTPAETREAARALGPACVLAQPGGLQSGVRADPELVDGSRVANDVRGLPLTAVPPADGALSGALPEVAAVVWTSGTGGRRRGVEITASGLAHSARASAARLGLGAADRWHASLQLAHVGGLALVTRAAAVGSLVVATGGFDAGRLGRLIDDGLVTHTSLVPVMLRALLEDRAGRGPPASFRLVLVGGARTPPDLLAEALERGWPVALTYGTTETTSQVATAAPDEVRARPESVGRPLDGVEVSFTSGGEILVRGPTVARGYFGRPGPLTDSDGWYRTGDLGRADADGAIRIEGRSSARIVTGGVTVDPAEVAEVLATRGGVAEVAVVGIPDDRWGELICAAVQPRPGHTVDLDDLRRHQASRLSAAKRARRLRILAELPRVPNGKVDTEAVRRLFLEDGPA